MTAVILLGHGSRDPRASDALRAFVDVMPEHGVQFTTHAAFLDHNRPTLQEVVNALPAGEADVVVVPMLLSTAFHAKSDVPQAIAELQTRRRVRTTQPIGAVRALAASAAATLQGPIVLGFSGTSDRRAREDLETLAAELAAERGSDVAVGYLTQAQPDVATAISSISAQGVVCYTLWPGMFTDRITSAATAAGIPCTAALWQNPLLAHAVIEVVDALSR